jgi:DNA primase
MMGLEVPRENTGVPERKDDNDELYALLREADQIYRAALRSSDRAIAYLKKRGIDGPTAGRFGIGYAPDAWDTVMRQLGTSDASIAKLLQAGLLSANDSGRRYDRFRDRIMFPIRSAKGQVIGFGGRVLDSGEPKYLNSPETPVFRKGHELYGLYEARQNPGRPKQIIVVEGYLDVASLVQFGVEYAVATLGTAMTTENLRRLSRLTDRIVFCFDGDAAGRAAALRAMETALPFGGGNVDIRFLLLPEKDDPDTFVRSQGADAFRALAAGAVALPEFFVDELDKRVDFKSTGGRGRFDVSAKPMLKRLPEGSYREAILDALRARMNLSNDVFRKLMEDAPALVVQRPAQVVGGKRKTVVQKVINLALHYPAAAARTGDSQRLAALNQPGADLLRRVFAAAAEIADGSTARVLETLRDDPDFQYLERIVAEPPLAIETEEDAAKELAASLDHLSEDAKRAADVARIISGNRPGTGSA